MVIKQPTLFDQDTIKLKTVFTSR